jgi:rubrerythrin
MKTKGHWVIKYANGWYFCGNNQFENQLRKAKIYVWKEKAEEQAEYLIKRRSIPADLKYEIIAISPAKELKDTEAEWVNAPEDPVFICSVCGYSALNDYRGNPVASMFCPHCGKYMTNHQQEED